RYSKGLHLLDLTALVRSREVCAVERPGSGLFRQLVLPLSGRPGRGRNAAGDRRGNGRSWSRRTRATYASQRERMVVVEPRGTGMALFTLRAAEEVRAAQFGMAEGELDAEMVAIAKTIIAQRTGSFDPTTYRDRYQEALQELIEAKMKGLTVKPREIAAPPPVIDLMTALKRSLAREASGSKHTAPKKAKMAPDRR